MEKTLLLLRMSEGPTSPLHSFHPLSRCALTLVNEDGILACAIVETLLVTQGAAYSPFFDEALGYPDNFSMSSINVKDKVTGVVTTIASKGFARYWLLFVLFYPSISSQTSPADNYELFVALLNHWPGVLIMLVASFAELFLQAPLFYCLGHQLIDQTGKIGRNIISHSRTDGRSRI